MRYSKTGKHLADEDIVAEEGDCLGEDRVVMVQGRGKDPFIEDGVSQDVDQKDFSLGDREAEKVNGDFGCGSAEDGGHTKLRGKNNMLAGTPYIFYQLEFSMLLSDCFRMSFQSGAVFCSSQVIRGFPCQETANRTPELEFKVYHKM